MIKGCLGLVMGLRKWGPIPETIGILSTAPGRISYLVLGSAEQRSGPHPSIVLISGDP